MSDERFARQVLMFGEEGQRKIEAQDVGIVGLGGLGSHVAQALAYLGVRRFLLVDDDRIEETNLNRVAGANPQDIGGLKVDVARDLILRINEQAEAIALPENLRTRRALELLISLIFPHMNRVYFNYVQFLQGYCEIVVLSLRIPYYSCFPFQPCTLRMKPRARRCWRRALIFC